MTKDNAVSRNFGIDLLRIVSMLMVVTLHTLGRGGILADSQYMSANYYLGWIMEIGAYCAVNCYALVSGYVGYSSKHKCSGIIYITFQVIFYIIAITAASWFVFPNVGKADIIASITHIRSGGYWYYKAYLGAFFFFPILNMAVEKLDKDIAKKFIFAILVLYSIVPMIVRSDLFELAGGYSPLWIMVMYFIGAYIRKYDLFVNTKKLKSFGIYAISVAITFISFITIGIVTKKFIGKSVLENVLISYTSPTIILCAVALLALFAKIQISDSLKKPIKFLTPLTFGVYLIHMQYFIRNWLTDRFTSVADLNPVLFVLATIGIILAIYLACTIIEFVRELIFKLLRIRKLSEKIAKLLRLS
ncbi:MAG: acyltransferase [Clostridia bacterium]|nr:acyltransferase [Clostridia bacterium]